MLSESDISNITLAMGLAVFIIFTINNRIAAQYMDAPNNTLGVSSIAGLLVFTIFTVFISLLKALGVLFDSSYYIIYLLSVIAINVFVFSVIFNVGFARGMAIAFFAYGMTVIVLGALTILIVWTMGFSDYRDAIEDVQPYLSEIIDYLIVR